MYPNALEMEVSFRRRSRRGTAILFFLGALMVASMVVAAEYKIQATLVAIFVVSFFCQMLAFLIYVIQIQRGVISAEEGNPRAKDVPNVSFLAPVLTGMAFAFSILAGIFAAALFQPPPF